MSLEPLEPQDGTLPADRPAMKGLWPCPACTFLNGPTQECEICKTPRISSQSKFSRVSEEPLTVRRPATQPSTFDPYNPPRYTPKVEGQSDLSLRVLETVQIQDLRGVWQPATAMLDTGNGALTIVDTEFARRLGLVGEGRNMLGAHHRTARVHGVVPGASSNLPVVWAKLRLKGREVTLEVGIGELQQQQILAGMDVLQHFFADGYTIGGYQ